MFGKVTWECGACRTVNHGFKNKCRHCGNEREDLSFPAPEEEDMLGPAHYIAIVVLAVVAVLVLLFNEGARQLVRDLTDRYARTPIALSFVEIWRQVMQWSFWSLVAAIALSGGLGVFIGGPAVIYIVGMMHVVDHYSPIWLIAEIVLTLGLLIFGFMTFDDLSFVLLLAPAFAVIDAAAAGVIALVNGPLRQAMGTGAVVALYHGVLGLAVLGAVTGVAIAAVDYFISCGGSWFFRVGKVITNMYMSLWGMALEGAFTLWEWVDEEFSLLRLAACISLQPFTLLYAFALLIPGGVVSALLTLIHAVIVVAIKGATYTWCGAMRLMDRLAVLIRGTKGTCSVCKREFRIPLYVCRGCGAYHRSLTPGTAGALYHRCACGQLMPASVLNGRGLLTAGCPECSTGTYLQRLEGDSRPVSIQLVGGKNAGKTVFMASVLTQVQETLAMRADTVVTPSDEERMQEVQRLYRTGINAATTDRNAGMYSLRVESPLFTPARLLSVYDIAGEFFTRQEEVKRPQVQLRSVDGIVLLVDVLSLLGEGELSLLGKDVRVHRATARNDDVVRGLVDHMDRVGARRSAGRFTMPVHVVITKLDAAAALLSEADDPLAVLYDAFLPGGDYPETAEERDRLCRGFIQSRGEENLLAMLDGNFSMVHYYAVSATGGELRRGQSLRPWPRVLAPVADIVQASDGQLYSLIRNRVI